jgi:hypothetical protein
VSAVYPYFIRRFARVSESAAQTMKREIPLRRRRSKGDRSRNRKPAAQTKKQAMPLRRCRSKGD